MKKLLIVLLIVGCEILEEEEETVYMLKLNENCERKSGTITQVNGSWKTNLFVIETGDTMEFKLPRGGSYTVELSGSEPYTFTLEQGSSLGETLNCDN